MNESLFFIVKKFYLGDGDVQSSSGTADADISVNEGLMNKVTCMNTIDSNYGFRPSSKIISEVFKGIY